MLDQKDWEDLQKAKQLLEKKSLAMKLEQVVGKPIELVVKNLPFVLQNIIKDVSKASIEKATHLVLYTMKKESREKKASIKLHRFLVTASGCVGGFFGGLGMVFEIPISTCLMIRSIADIARSEGEDLTTPETRLACVEVLAFGGIGGSQNCSDVQEYFAIRKALEKEVTKALEYLAEQEISLESAPALVRFVAKVAEKFGVQITEKVAAEMIPVVGAVGAASVNLIFIKHFQDLAQGHFIIRRLERKYGGELIERAITEESRV